MIIVELYTVALLGGRQVHNRRRHDSDRVILAIVLIEGFADVGGVATRVPLVFGSLAFGDTVRSRRALRAAADERAEREAREREEGGPSPCR